MKTRGQESVSTLEDQSWIEEWQMMMQGRDRLRPLTFWGLQLKRVRMSPKPEN